MKKVILIFLLSQSLFAQNYKRVNMIEMTPAKTSDILERLHISENEAIDFSCASQKHSDLFSYDTHFQGKDSLRVFDKRNKEKYIFKNSSLYLEKSGKKVRERGLSDYVKGVLDILVKLEKNRLAYKLISKMQASPYPFYILEAFNHLDGRDLTLPLEEQKKIETKRKNQLSNMQAISYLDLKTIGPKVFEKSGIEFNQIGGKGSIGFSLKPMDYVTTNYEWKKDEAMFSLIHEMFHAYDATRGLLDRRSVVEKKDGEEFMKETVAEYRAVYFTNHLRKTFGKPFRRFYGNIYDQEGKPKSEKELKKMGHGMLNNQNDPILITSACINWL